MGRKMTPKTMVAVIVAATVVFVALFGSSRAASTWPIEEGKEYQLGIEEDDFGDGVEKRSSAIGEYVEFFTDYLMVHRFDTDFQEEVDMRSEGHFKINKCNPPDYTKVRLRIWFEGNSKGLSSIDLKYFKDGASRSDALRQPLGPSQTYFDQASQDIEEGLFSFLLPFAFLSEFPRLTLTLTPSPETILTLEKTSTPANAIILAQPRSTFPRRAL